jgi:hypothetical protein
MACCLSCLFFIDPNLAGDSAASGDGCVAWAYDTRTRQCWPKFLQIEIPFRRIGFVSMDMHLNKRRTAAPTPLPSSPPSAQPTDVPITPEPTLSPSAPYQYGPAASSTAPCWNDCMLPAAHAQQQRVYTIAGQCRRRCGRFNSLTPSLLPTAAPTLHPSGVPVTQDPSQQPTVADTSDFQAELKLLRVAANVCKCSEDCWIKLRDW